MFRFDYLQSADCRNVHLILRLCAAVAKLIVSNAIVMLWGAGLRKVDDDAFQLDLFRLLPCRGKGLFGRLLGFLCGLLFQPFQHGV